MAFTSLGVVLVSTMTFVLGTFPEFQPENQGDEPAFDKNGVQIEKYPTVQFAMDIIGRFVARDLENHLNHIDFFLIQVMLI